MMITTVSNIGACLKEKILNMLVFNSNSEDDSDKTVNCKKVII